VRIEAQMRKLVGCDCHTCTIQQEVTIHLECLDITDCLRSVNQVLHKACKCPCKEPSSEPDAGDTAEGHCWLRDSTNLQGVR